MSKLAVLLIVMLLVGCASTDWRETENPPPILAHSWQQLQTVLQHAPVELRHAVAQSVEPRLLHADLPEQPDAVAPQEPRAVLIDILTRTGNSYLLSDGEFARVNAIVTGEGRQRQSYATALANYLTLPDFVCQQPVYGRYFQGRYGASPVAKPCPEEVPFSVLTQDEGAQIVWLDPRRVKSIHLLFAGKSRSMASRFGHVALRLVVCPEGKATEADCDSNLFEHVVLGFRAHIDELSLDTLKALSGDYKTYLFANRFMDVYQEYAIDEFREIYSLPLRMDDAQRETMVRELAEIHWSYAGSYNFFTRNCATILQKALRATWRELAMHEGMGSDPCCQ